MGSPQTDVQMWSAPPGATSSPAFKTTRRGYDRAQVEDHLRLLTERLRDAESQTRSSRAEAVRAREERDAALAERDSALMGRAGDAYEQVSSRVADLMMGVDREADKIRAEAQARADRIVADARNEALGAQSEADRKLMAADHAARQAREEVERSVADLTSRRDGTLAELRATSARLLDLIASLEASPSEPEAPIDDVDDGGETADPADALTTAPRVVIPDVHPDHPR